MKKITLSLLFMLMMASTQAQQHNASHQYVKPKDPQVVQKLEDWKQLKFGLLMHWGTYSQWGVVESWSLCPEDEGWCERKGPYSANWYEYKKNYENLQTTFNPTKFNPEKWATAAKDAGMKYVVFTTKHHDGFCMFDTKQTDYKITDPKTPFSSNPRSNIAKEVFGAFRQEGFMVGAYFSKPDWHQPDFWWPYFPPKDRNPSYNPAKYPDHWQKFKDFTYNQINELTSDYGKLDILWLDGGWVRPPESIDTSVSWQKAIPYNQSIDMPKIAKMARQNQPGILIVDRTVTGEYENYVTPEQQVPAEKLPYPWESCMTLGDSWSYIPKENFKSSRKVIHLLTDIVSKGGSLLLNVAPGPDGEWHEEAYQRFKEIGEWMRVNGDAIYGTTVSTLPNKDNWVFTAKDKATYAIYQVPENTSKMPAILSVPINTLPVKYNVEILGNIKKLKWKVEDNQLKIQIPETLQNQPPRPEAWVVKITEAK